MTTTIYEQLSIERKGMQADGHLPDWFTTGGWQLFKDKYRYDAIGLRDTFTRIAETAASHLPETYRTYFEKSFFNLM